MSEKNTLQASQLEFMQKHLRQLRILCDWSANDMASILGVTRQTINNLETFKTKLTPPFYLAIGAMLDQRSKQSHLLREHLNVCFNRFPILKLDDKVISLNVDNIAESWFTTFPEQFSEMTYDYEAEDPLVLRILTQKVCQNGTIFMCPDVLFKAGGLDGVEELCDICQEYGKRIIIPYKALQEEGHRLNEDDFYRLQKLCDEKLISYCGSSNDSELHSLIISQFLRLKHRHQLCLITEDGTLAEDVEHLNALKSISGFPIRTFSMHSGGRLKPWFPQTMVQMEENTPVERSLIIEQPFNGINQVEAIAASCTASTIKEEDSINEKHENSPGQEIVCLVKYSSEDLDDWLQL